MNVLSLTNFYLVDEKGVASFSEFLKELLPFLQASLPHRNYGATYGDPSLPASNVERSWACVVAPKVRNSWIFFILDKCKMQLDYGLPRFA